MIKWTHHELNLKKVINTCLLTSFLDHVIFKNTKLNNEYSLVRHFFISSADISILQIVDMWNARRARKCEPLSLENCACESRCFLQIVGNLMMYVRETRKSNRIKRVHRIYRGSDRFKKYRGDSVDPQRMEYPGYA